MDHINPAHTISAALCYATQLATILSHILDVNLPKRLCNRWDRNLPLPTLAGQRREDGASASFNVSEFNSPVCSPVASSAERT